MHQQFCDILFCDKKSSKYGIRFRPLSGNTIFWYNVDEHGQGDEWTCADKFYWPSDKN